MRPEPMTFAEIVCRTDSLLQMISVLYRHGCVQIEDSRKLSENSIEHCAFPDQDIYSARNMLEQTTSALKALGADISSSISIDEFFQLPDTLKEVQLSIKTSEKINDLHKRILQIEEKKKQALQAEFFLSWLSSMNIEANLCRSSDRMTIMCGIIPHDNDVIVSRDEDIMSVFSQPLYGVRYVIAVFLSEKSGGNGKERMETLHRAGFSPIDIESPSEQSVNLSAQKAVIQKEIDAFRAELPVLIASYRKLSEYLSIAEEIRKCGITGQCAHIACWIPAYSALELMRQLCSRWKDRCAFRFIPAEHTLEENAFKSDEIPSLLSRSKLFEPFRTIVGAYAWPAYRHIDPTAPSALFFLVFFGIMFADVGHGLIIAFLGILLRLFMKRKTLLNTGILMIYCGIAAAFGGLLFGSVFGHENLIKPLLFHPGSHIGSFLVLGVVIGIIVMSTGIILNIVQTLWRKDISGAFFSQWGFISLGFYWLCAGIIFHAFGNTSTGGTHTGVIILTALPLIAMIAGEIITQKKKGHFDAAETAFRPVEILLGLLSNTVSFVRIAAFGLCHAALMNAVYIIASSGPDSSFYRTMVSVEGNILVICLEALVVSIQCVRLQFYEFYSKFFGTSGKRFMPLRKTSPSREVL